MTLKSRNFAESIILNQTEGVFATYAPELALEYDEIGIVSIGEANDGIVPLVRKRIAVDIPKRALPG